MSSFLPVHAVLATVAVVGSEAVAPSPSELLERGIYTEETVGDLAKAIEIYTEIVATAETNRLYVAQAQYRLGCCLLKQGRQSQAVEAFEKLIEQYPEQDELIAKAKRHVPRYQGLKLEPEPWVDGESLQLRVKLAGGLEIGDFVFAVQSDELDGQNVWRTRLGRYIATSRPSYGAGFVYADRDTFRPIESVLGHFLVGRVEAKYESNHVTVRTEGIDGTQTVREADLDQVCYDNDQCAYVLRRLPLEVGYKVELPIYIAVSSGKTEIEAEVVGTETLEVPAGTFECYKVDIPCCQETYWFSTDRHRYLVQLEDSSVKAELASIRVDVPGKPIHHTIGVFGLTMSAPSGWCFSEHTREKKAPQIDVMFLDPEAIAFSMMRVSDIELLEPEQRGSPRAFAESDVVEGQGAFRDYEVRPGSWREFEVAGQPAVSFVADYVERNRKMVECTVCFLTDAIAAEFSAKLPQEDFDTYREKFDSIVSSCRFE
jgi:hypothetical protein